MLGDFIGYGLVVVVGVLFVLCVFYIMVSKGMLVSDIVVEINIVLGNLLLGYMFCVVIILELSKFGRSVLVWLGGLFDIYVINEKGNII